MGKGTLRTIAGAATMMDLYEGHDVDDDDRVKRGEEAGRFLLDSCYEDIAFAPGVDVHACKMAIKRSVERHDTGAVDCASRHLKSGASCAG